jgi:hypothetical protein
VAIVLSNMYQKVLKKLKTPGWFTVVLLHSNSFMVLFLVTYSGHPWMPSAKEALYFVCYLGGGRKAYVYRENVCTAGLSSVARVASSVAVQHRCRPLYGEHTAVCTSLPIRATCPAHLSLLDLITRMIFDEEYRAWSSNLLHEIKIVLVCERVNDVAGCFLEAD